jgi:hypothetical protein
MPMYQTAALGKDGATMRRRPLQIVLVAAWMASSGCVSDKPDGTIAEDDPEACRSAAAAIDLDNPVRSLNRLSDLFRAGCFRETIDVGNAVKDRYRHKTYSVVKESIELFIPEGTVTDYVLESYERGYVTFLMAASYHRLHLRDDVTVELNRLYNEETALLYNHGQDPINALLQAAMWENVPRAGFSSRPFWLHLAQSEEADPELKAFAKKRIKAIDAKTASPHWRIAAVGRFPAVDWSFDFVDSKSGYFRVRPKRPFSDTCATSHSLRVSTRSWFNKIAIRHAGSYHPLVNAKSWIRLPVGIAYGVTTAAAGAGIAVGGCAADAAARGNGALCHVSIRGGVAVMAKSADVVDYALEPDLRHWEKVPEAIWISSLKNDRGDRCAPSDPARLIGDDAHLHLNTSLTL